MFLLWSFFPTINMRRSLTLTLYLGQSLTPPFPSARHPSPCIIHMKMFTQNTHNSFLVNKFCEIKIQKTVPHYPPPPLITFALERLHGEERYGIYRWEERKRRDGGNLENTLHAIINIWGGDGGVVLHPELILTLILYYLIFNTTPPSLPSLLCFLVPCSYVGSFVGCIVL